MELVNGSVSGDVVSALLLRFALQQSEVVIVSVERVLSTVRYTASGVVMVEQRVFHFAETTSTFAVGGEAMVESVQLDFVGDRAVNVAKSLETLPVADAQLVGLHIAKITDGFDVSKAPSNTPPTSDAGGSSTTTMIIAITVPVGGVLVIMVLVTLWFCACRQGAVRRKGTVVEDGEGGGMMLAGTNGNCGDYDARYADPASDELRDMDLGMLAEVDDDDIELYVSPSAASAEVGNNSRNRAASRAFVPDRRLLDAQDLVTAAQEGRGHASAAPPPTRTMRTSVLTSISRTVERRTGNATKIADLDI